MTQNNSEEPKYFDLHARGIGYLNRIREVQVRRGPGFMACDIAALYGPADAAQYTRFDCKVSGAEHRNGPTGTVHCAFLAEQARFASLASASSWRAE